MNPAVEWGLLVGSALLAGAVNTLAGGGTLLTFPSLIQFGGLTKVMANGTSTVALVPGSLAGAWGYRRELGEAAWWLRVLTLPSVLGGVTGALLVTRLPERFFEALVPWLLLTASLLFLAQPRLARLLPSPPPPPSLARGPDGGRGAGGEGGRPGRPGRAAVAGVVGFQFLVAVYGGYFGAGIGILMITSLALMGLGDVHRINSVKTLLAAAINGASVLVFVADGQVDWRRVGPMAVGAIAGGYLGAAVGRRLPKAAVRWFVICVGLGLAGYYFVK